MYRRSRPWLAVLGLSLAAFPSFAQKATATRESGNGLHVVRLEAPSGSLHVYLPDDLAAGDRISGTVYALPAGAGAEREDRTRELLGYRTEIAGQVVEPGNGRVWLRQLDEAPGALAVRFRDAGGRQVAEALLPVARASTARPQAFSIPTFGQAGHALAVAGPFTGDLGTVTATMGGTEAQILAQSPRQTVLRVPPELTGASVLRLQGEGREVEAPFRVLDVQLSAGKLDLRRGERTTLRVEVRGLEGLEEPIPLTLSNATPQVVRLGSGDSEAVTIRPGDEGPGGVWTLTRPIESRRTGGFTIDATVGPASRRTEVAVPGDLPPLQGGPPREAEPRDEAPSPCSCQEIAVTVGPAAPKVERKAGKVTLTVPFSATMTCQGSEGKCAGSVKLSAKATGWLVRKGGRRGGNAEPVDPEVTLQLAGAKENAVELPGECPKKKGEGKGTAAVEIHLGENVEEFSGPVALTFERACGAGEAPKTEVTVFVDSKVSNRVNLPFSDLDGNGMKDYRVPAPSKPASATDEPAGCVCTSAMAELAARTADVKAENIGSLVLVTVTLPYTGKITCAKGKGKCRGEVTAAAEDWKVGAGESHAFLEGSLAQSSIPCSGACSGRETPLPAGALTYQAVLRGAQPVKGSLDLSLTPVAPCQGAAAAFTVEVDSSKSGAGRLSIKPKK